MKLRALLATCLLASLPLCTVAFAQTISPGGTSGTPQPVTPSTGTYTNRSSTIATGGTSQTLAAVNATRKQLIIQNPCTAAEQGIATAEDLAINFTSAASVTGGASIILAPCGSYDSGIGPVTTELVTVVAATTAHKFIAKEM